MTFEQFCYWLQGYFELSKADNLSKEQREVIEEHLNLCFNKTTVKKVSKEKSIQDILDEIAKSNKDKKTTPWVPIEYPPLRPYDDITNPAPRWNPNQAIC